MTVDSKDTSVPKDGAFAYSVDKCKVSACNYFEIINEREDTEKGFDYLTALGKKEITIEITALDGTTEKYNAFFNKTSGYADAIVYDRILIKYYGVTSSDSNHTARFNMKAVKELDSTLDVTDCFVATHYGDWPAPEIFVFNSAG